MPRSCAGTGQPVFVTLAEAGSWGMPGDVPEHVHGPPGARADRHRGAGDAVTANLATALAAGGGLREAMELAMAAASLVIHQLVQPAPPPSRKSPDCSKRNGGD